MSTHAKLPPIHPSEVLNEEFPGPMNIAQYRLANCTGVDPRRIHSIVHGQRSMTAETALLLGCFFGNCPGFRMGLQAQYDLEVTQDRMAERLADIIVDPGLEDEVVEGWDGSSASSNGESGVTNRVSLIRGGSPSVSCPR